MSHAVHYRDAAGNIHLEDRPSLDAALELVERLQNEDGPTGVRVFREVPIEVKTYYRVVAVAADTDAPSTESVAESVDEPVATEPVATEPVEAPVAAEPAEVVAPTASPEPAVAEAHEPAVAEVARLTPVEPPSGATVMSPPPVSAAPAEDAGDAHDAEPRGERRQLFSRG
jgi:hypothetical protein